MRIIPGNKHSGEACAIDFLLQAVAHVMPLCDGYTSTETLDGIWSLGCGNVKLNQCELTFGSITFGSAKLLFSSECGSEISF